MTIGVYLLLYFFCTMFVAVLLSTGAVQMDKMWQRILMILFGPLTLVILLLVVIVYLFISAIRD